jgi:nucleoside-triphosphatase
MECRLLDATQTSSSIVNRGIILLTGLPGCGKTTLVRRVIERLGDLRLAGFYTRELLGADGRRVGFEAIGLNGGRTNLAHVQFKSKIRVGRYGVELEGFERLLSEELDGDCDADLFVVDEIGKMECYSRRFVDLVQQLLDGETRVLATVAMKGSGLIQSVKQRQDVDLITVSAGNRDDLVEALVERIARAIL